MITNFKYVVLWFGVIVATSVALNRTIIIYLLCLDLYIAPEVYRDEIFDRSVDTFSFGLILYEVCLSSFIFPLHTISSLLNCMV